MRLDIGKEVAALERLTLGKLRERYAEVFGEPTNSNSKPWLIRRIAWRLQERAHGGLSERVRRRAEELADDADLRTMPPRERNGAIVGPTAKGSEPPAVAPLDCRLPLPGTVLERKYKGRVLHVKILADGFEFDGERYGSLSAVAKAATRSHCNGFAFFSLDGKGDRS
jgi:Protein of unknown function (DUF2924)